MEKSNKMMLGAALAVALLALAGAGYAATYYTATTDNTSNELEATYIKLSQSGTGMYEGEFVTDLKYDTENGKTVADAGKFIYKPVATHKLDNSAYVALQDADGHHNTSESGYIAVISEALSLKVDKSAGNAATSAALTIKTTGLSAPTGLTYKVALTDSGTTSASIPSAKIIPITITDGAGTATFSDVSISAESTTYVVFLLAEGQIDATANAVSTQETINITFEMKVTVS